jgi:glycosyltransferase involved in cell wall biosynthesis
MVLLIGNYALDRQQSMQRFGQMMLEGLTAAGVPAELIRPEPMFGNFQRAGAFVAKWLAYVDKFVLFPRQLRAKLRSSAPELVHICDHSNAMYAGHCGGLPVVVTCHDFLAIRGGLGEETDTPASSTGRYLQRWIVSGLQKATALACVSKATLDDAERFVRQTNGRPELHLIPLGLSYPFRHLPRAEAEERLRGIPRLRLDQPFVLHVGSNLRRKNREAILRIFARCQGEWQGQLVFVGEPLNDELLAQAQQLGISDRIVQVREASSEHLEALYNCAGAFLFPSRFEGFGWPIIEAQACGCPVVCSSVAPMGEIAGSGALVREPADEEGFAHDLLQLLAPGAREHWSARALENAQRFTTARMISEYRNLYRSLTPAAC